MEFDFTSLAFGVRENRGAVVQRANQLLFAAILDGGTSNGGVLAASPTLAGRAARAVLGRQQDQ